MQKPDNQMYHLLFVDDDRDFLNSMNMAVSRVTQDRSSGVELETHFVSDPREGLSFARELTKENEKIAVIVSDQQMPVLSGIEFMEQANSIVPNAIKVLLTGYASLESAKYAINHSILDQYVSKPIEDYDNFASLIRNAVKTFYFREEKERAEDEIRRYVQELERKNEKIRDMHLAAEKIAYLAQGFRRLDLNDVMDLIISKIPNVFGAKYSSLFLLDEEKKKLQMVRSNYLNDIYEIPITADEKTPMMVALKENRTIVLPEIQQASYDYLNKNCLGSSCIIIPFVIGAEDGSADIMGNAEGIKGVLNMGNIPDMGNEDIIHYTASLIRNILGINILNARLYQKTQRLALFDGLTGIYNKHIFMELLNKECAYSERFGNPLYLALSDIDDFKLVNDTHGHRIGDEVLSQIGHMLNSAARKSDVVARFGGEEFVWLINGGELDNIISFLDKFRVNVSGINFSELLNLSLSMGLTRYFPNCNDTIEKFIDRADKALYQAKANGKNRIEVLLENEDKRG